MGGGRITSIGIIDGFSEGSINIDGFNDDESLLDIRNTHRFSVKFNLKLINFSLKKKHDGISPPLAQKFGVVHKVVSRHPDSAMLRVTCEGILFTVIAIIITVFVVSATAIISEFSLG